MRKRQKLWIFLGCGVALVLILALWREREPRYEDHTLLEWVAIAEYGDKDSEYSKKDGEKAVRQIGTNAVPFLIKCIEYRERPWQTRLGALCDKLPGKFGEPLSKLVVGHGAERQVAAFSGLCILGPQAKSAIPVLTNLLTTQLPAADYCIRVLAQMGDEGLPPILGMLTNQSKPLRLAAVSTLGYPDAKFTFNPGIGDILTSCLDDSDRELAYRAAGVLCVNHFNENLALRTFAEAIQGNDKRLQYRAAVIVRLFVLGRSTIPTIIQFLQDTNSPFSDCAAAALGDIPGYKTPDPAIMPALTNSLHDPRAPVRACAAESISRLREAGEPAASMLLDLWDDPDESVRKSATNAFFDLPSYYPLTHPAGISQEQADIYDRRYGLVRPKRGQNSQQYVYAPALTRLLDHPDIRIREMATNALQTLRGSTVVNQTNENTSH